MDKIKLLVTGHRGYIGTHLCERLKRDGIEFEGCDIAEDSDGYRGVSGREIDTVIHLAAFVSVQESFLIPYVYFRNNTDGLIRLINNNKIKRFIFASTCAVYGNNHNAKEHEAAYSKCTSPYAQSKFLGEQIIKTMCPDHAIVRLGNVFGGNQSIRGEASAMQHFAVDNPIVVYGGEQVRDFVHIKHVVNALVLLATEKDYVTGPINIGSGNGGLSIKNLAEIGAVTRGVPIQFKPRQVNDADHIVLNIDKARSYQLL